MENQQDPTDVQAVEEDLVERTFDQLIDANPVSLDESRASAWDGADSLFAQITSRPAAFEPYAEPAAAETSAASRRWPILTAVAAALVLLIGAVAVLVPGSSQPALAAVTSAADETAQANSGRIVTSFTATGQEDADSENLSGTITALFNGADLAVTVDVDQDSTVVDSSEAAGINAAETRMVDGQVFLTPDGEQWVSIEAPEILRSALVQFTDLRSILAQVSELVEVEEIGSESLDGVSVTRYRSEVDLADESLAESGWIPGAGGSAMASPVDIEAEGLVTIDMFVDDDGQMRRIEVSGEAVPEDPSIDASAEFSVVTDFVDLGSDIEIEAPDPASVESLEGFDFEGLSD